MSLGRIAWLLRNRLVGPERVVTGGHVQALRRSGALGLRARARVQVLHLREVVLGPPWRARLPIGRAKLELGSGHDFPVDWKAFVEIFGDAQYAAPYMGAHVLDVGAHKGYFGAYALCCGASVVLSFEPAAKNFEALEQAAGPLGNRWLVKNAALGARAGTGTLLLDRTSWAHSLLQVESPAGEQPVAIVTLADALADLPPGGSRTIVKIDAEGSECDILSRPESLEQIDVLMVEWHSSASCTAEALARVIESAGLIAVGGASGGIMRFERR